MKKHKIIIAPLEAAGYMKGLQSGFKALGIESKTYEAKKDKFYTKKEKDSFFCKRIRESRIFIFIHRILFFVVSLLKYNTFLFLSGTSFFRLSELWLLKLLRKNIIFVFLGSDSRPPYINGVCLLDPDIQNKDCFSPQNSVSTINGEDLYLKTTAMKKKIQHIEKYADIIINHKPTALFHEKPFFDFLLIGYPFFDQDSIKTKNNQTESFSGSKMKTNIKILHAPSRPLTKGTYKVRELINLYKQKGYKIDYVELVNVPNYKVLQLIKECDFIFDSIYSDTPLGGLGVEGAFFGKPTLVSGYYAKHIRNELPEEAIPPSYYVEPEEIELAFKKMLEDKNFRIKLGERAQIFVKKNWNSKFVAQKILDIIDGIDMDNYIVDPKKLYYFQGSAINKEVFCKKNREYYNKYGKEAFLLQDKPTLENNLIQFLEQEE